ncbi:alpha/beta hydrolase [Corynebacterium kalidii]|uniref:Alpha/beta hydrolase n=1 Tax=Corynebacterium kalidii TaxID=2931982 RepID=A0A9X1WI29_9CORY|nr:alpha/beta hydrolase [Corynebacterium kalidii]
MNALSHQNLATVLSRPLGQSVHELDFEPDFLGEGYTHHTVDLGVDPDGEPEGDPGAVRCTLVRYRPEDTPEWGERPAVLFVHGMTDYFFQTHVAEHFHGLGYAVYGIDLRKCGRSHREGQTWHHVSSQSLYDEDLAVALSMLSAGHGSTTLVGHSTGGLDVTMFVSRLHSAARSGDTARAALHDTVDAVILNSPWLDLQLDRATNLIIRRVFPHVARFWPTWHVPGGISPTYGQSLHRSEYGEWGYDLGLKPLHARPKQVSWLVGVSREITRLHTGGFSTGVPTLLLCSDTDGAGGTVTGADGRRMPDAEAFASDTVLKPSQMRAAAHLVDPDCEVRVIPGAMHDVFLSRPDVRAAAFAAVDDWVDVPSVP